MAIVLTATETQAAIAATADALLADHYDFAARRAALAAGPGHSPALWALLAETGLLGTEASEAAGGIGGGFGETAVVLEALGRALAVVPFVPTVVLGLGVLAALDHAEFHRALVAEAVAGATLLALAPGTGVAATPQPGGWRLHGTATTVLGGNIADVILVAAATPAGTSLFRVPAIAPSVERRNFLLYDAMGAADLILDTEVGPDALIGGDGAAQAALDLAADRGAAAAIHEAIGAMARLCAMTPEYLQTRVQFGQPLARFQVLQHRMVDMGIALEEARSMALLATAAFDKTDPADRARAISAAKVKVGEAARFVGQAAVQLHGGIALTDDYPAGHYFKRLTMLARQFGDELFHLDRYVALGT